MSSSPSRPYQSKVFNFFNQHSRRLSQKLENTIRNLQVATKWSVEALLYPIYQIFQPDALTQKRLNTPTKPTQLHLKSHNSPPADAPIQDVLELVKNLPSAAASESETLQNVKSLGFLGKTLQKIANPLKRLNSQNLANIQPENTLQYHIPTIQGIAVKIENRNLVLVGENNKIFDVLTISQQRQLTDKINIEIAESTKVIKLPGTKKQQDLLPEIDRLLNKLTNNHANSEITEVTASVKSAIQPYPHKIFAFLDTALAKLEAKSIVPVKQRSQEIIKVAKTQLDIFIYGREQVSDRDEISVNSQGLKNPTLDISAIIESAVNYFFGGRKIAKLGENETFYELPNQTVNKFVDVSQIQSSEITGNSWLTWGDLFGSLENKTNIKEEKKQELLNTEKHRIFQGKTSTAETASASWKNKTETEKQQHKLNPDWIETTATFIGYEKHPLEQILAWLDHVMLWIEMIFVNIIYFLKGFFQS